MRTILLGDVGNRLDIADTEQSIEVIRRGQQSAARTIQIKDGEIATLRSELGQQKLAVQALTRFLVEKEVISQDELDDFIHQVDAEDGVIDGKMSIEPQKRRLIFSRKEVSEGTYKKIHLDRP